MPDLATDVAVVSAAATQVNTTAKGTIDTLPWRAAVEILADLDSALVTLNQIRASLARRLYLAAPHGTTELDGLGLLDVRRSKNRTHWDDRSGVHDYVGAKIEATGGEMVDPATVVDWVLEVAGVQYLRVGALRGAHLDVEDYCHTEPGAVSVTLTRPG